MRINALDDTNLDRWRFNNCRHFVVQHTIGNTESVDKLGTFRNCLAHTHPDRAFNLAFNAKWVECFADILCSPDFVNGNFKGIGIDADFNYLRRISIRHAAADRTAAVFFGAPGFR